MTVQIAGWTWSNRRGELVVVFKCSKCDSVSLDMHDIEKCYHCGAKNKIKKGVS